MTDRAESPAGHRADGTTRGRPRCRPTGARAHDRHRTRAADAGHSSPPTPDPSAAGPAVPATRTFGGEPPPSRRSSGVRWAIALGRRGARHRRDRRDRRVARQRAAERRRSRVGYMPATTVSTPRSASTCPATSAQKLAGSSRSSRASTTRRASRRSSTRSSTGSSGSRRRQADVHGGHRAVVRRPDRHGLRPRQPVGQRRRTRWRRRVTRVAAGTRCSSPRSRIRPRPAPG